MRPLSAFNVDQLLHIFLFPFYETISKMETVAISSDNKIRCTS
nr:MAG TPA: hypothetical protein [Caudoviricetes sp.]